ncbi:unnamed protein product [Penicillium roqueforti FM164]|uniref:Genomic scaffold, ProqFM164S01 n=1 Tax=Penicillium roqueforti (strain FM164) TaxID=1365484 RepID=W6PYD4_PENRF|nr:unnamed protein product [Penicillium roqueforti FM164]
MKFRNVSLPQIETDLELCQVFEPQSRTPSPLYERIIGNFRTIVLRLNSMGLFLQTGDFTD